MAFGGFNNDEEDGVMSEINVTPLVDVMLVLLIVFMLSIPAFTNSINVQLPTANAEKPIEAPKILRIAIDKDAQYYLDNQELSFDSLNANLEQIFAQNKEAVITIRADKDVNYDAVMKVLEAARKIGFAKIGFVTKQPE